MTGRRGSAALPEGAEHQLAPGARVAGGDRAAGGRPRAAGARRALDRRPGRRGGRGDRHRAQLSILGRTLMRSASGCSQTAPSAAKRDLADPEARRRRRGWRRRTARRRRRRRRRRAAAAGPHARGLGLGRSAAHCSWRLRPSGRPATSRDPSCRWLHPPAPVEEALDVEGADGGEEDPGQVDRQLGDRPAPLAPVGVGGGDADVGGGRDRRHRDQHPDQRPRLGRGQRQHPGDPGDEGDDEGEPVGMGDELGQGAVDAWSGCRRSARWTWRSG